ncbi:hypothetical protein A33Q_1663 [Indibacter alkaliphilus LW1]|uniref:Uncharacterized protein n=1 Tax=Indibacter alkaliphilus (strain CCUG 57479 / KCTC 22604 / LW1) TaxID=1189612 RepID=S2DFY8_INDAL|nr:hypothetical protein A33Q_1663 [Indibacter alkaliphilus LW1]
MIAKYHQNKLCLFQFKLRQSVNEKIFQSIAIIKIKTDNLSTK